MPNWWFPCGFSTKCTEFSGIAEFRSAFAAVHGYHPPHPYYNNFTKNVESYQVQKSTNGRITLVQIVKIFWCYKQPCLNLDLTIWDYPRFYPSCKPTISVLETVEHFADVGKMIWTILLRPTKWARKPSLWPQANLNWWKSTTLKGDTYGTGIQRWNH